MQETYNYIIFIYLSFLFFFGMVINFSSALVVEFCKQLKINKTFGTHNKTLITRYLIEIRLATSGDCFYTHIHF